MIEKLYAPTIGTVKDITACSDIVFAEKMLGDGIMVQPLDNRIYAPAKGTIKSITDSKHAITMTTEAGLDILVHIGIDTVELGGEGFDSHINAGDEVNQGELLLTVDWDKVRSKGYETDTLLIVLNKEKMLNKLDLEQQVSKLSYVLEVQ